MNTWPLVPHFSSQVVGIPGDAYQTLWHFWLVSRWPETGQSPLETHLIFWPTGTGLWVHVSNVVNALAVWPILRSLGPIAAYNAAVLGNLVLGAFGTYLLGFRLFGDRAAATLAGLAFGFCAYFSGHLLGHLILLSAGFIPLGALGFIDAVATGRLRSMLLAGVAFALSVATLVHGLFLALFAGLALAWISLRAVRGDRTLATVWRRAIATGSVALACALPFVIGLHSELRATEGVVVPASIQSRYSADLQSWLTPNPFNPVLGPLVQPWIEAQMGRPPALAEGLVFPGFTVLILALAALWPAPGDGRRAWPLGLGPPFWASLAALCIVLSLGPDLRVAGAHTGIALPFAALARLPGFATLSAPSRFAMLGQLALALLAAGGLTRLRAALTPGRARAVTATALTLVAFECLWLPYPTAALPTPSPFLETLRREGSSAAVLDVPFLTYDVLPMVGQMTHGRPILNGYVSRMPADCVACSLPAPFSSLGLEPERKDILPPFDGARDGAAVLRSFGVGHVLLHRDRLAGPALARVLGTVHAMGLGSPVYEDDRLEAYVVPGTTSDAPVVTAALVLGINFDYGGWSELSAQPGEPQTRTITRPEAGARMRLWASAPARARLRFAARKAGPGRFLRLTLEGADLFGERIGPEPRPVDVVLPLHRGSNTLVFQGGMAIGPMALDLLPAQ